MSMASSSLKTTRSFIHHGYCNPNTFESPSLLSTRTSISPAPMTIKALWPVPSPLFTQDDLKKLAAHKAVDYVSRGMVLGLGTGSTAAFVVSRIGELLNSGELKHCGCAIGSICLVEYATRFMVLRSSGV